MAPIHSAARNGEYETLCRLLDQGASPDDVHTSTGRTPLHWLCCSYEGGDLIACFELLRAAGANLDATDSGGCVPLHYAPMPPILTSMLIEAGASVNVKDTSYGRTPLHWAARYRATGSITVPLLLRAGAAVNAVDWDGNMPLTLAIEVQNRRVLPILLRAGADIPPGYRGTCPYISRVFAAGGFKKHEQAHITRITAILAPTPRLPPEMVRKIVEFWLHAGYY